MNNNKKTDTDLVEDYFLNNYNTEEVANKYQININTLKSKIRKKKKNVFKKYRNIYPNDINFESLNKRKIEKSLTTKDYKKDVEKILLKKDIIKIITSLNCNNVKRMVYIDYIFNKLTAIELKSKYKLKSVETVYQYKTYINKMLHMKFID